MAAKRFTKSAIDWAAFVERIPPAEKAKFQQFKSKVDGYTTRYIHAHIHLFLRERTVNQSAELLN